MSRRSEPGRCRVNVGDATLRMSESDLCTEGCGVWVMDSTPSADIGGLRVPDAGRPAAPIPARRLNFRDLTQDDLDAIATELNDRPRQTLGFKTPSEGLAEVLR